MPSRRGVILLFGGLAALTGLLLARHAAGAIDFLAYYQNARHVFGNGADMYGPASGMGWAGGVYRYPPIFLYLFAPLAWLPLPLAVALWGAAKILALGWLLLALCRRWNLAFGLWMAPALLLLAPYAVQELRYGNAQWLIVIACAAAWLAVDRHPVRGGLWLGLAAALKIWPVFFLPFVLLRRRWRCTVAAIASGLSLTLLPALWLGWAGWLALARAWQAQEQSISALNRAAGEIFYPGQSLHDVLMRFCAFIDYSRTPDARYRQVDWFHLAPARVELLWTLAVAVLLGAAVWLIARLREPMATADSDAVPAFLFALLLVVQPHIHRIIFVTLLWPALYAARLWFEGRLAAWARSAWMLAVFVAVAEPLVPGSARQRLFQVYGVDFWGVLLPLTAILAWQVYRLGSRRALPALPALAAAAPLPPGAGRPRACIVVPTCNEARHLEPLLASVFAQQEKISTHDLWVVIVDGESDDGTAPLLSRLEARYPRLRALSRPRQGLGDAYQYGFAYALDTLQAERVLQMDGDLQHDPALLPRLLDSSWRGGAAVIGSRFAPGGETPGLSRYRRASSRFANWLIQRVTGLPHLYDYTSGYRCLPAATLRRIPWSDLGARGYAFQTALIAEVLLSGATVLEIPMRFGFRAHGESKLRPADYAEFVRNLPRLRAHCRALRARSDVAQAAGAGAARQ